MNRLESAWPIVRAKAVMMWNRLRQRSTLAGLTAAITGAMGVDQPWKTVLIVLGILGVLYPEGPSDAA